MTNRSHPDGTDTPIGARVLPGVDLRLWFALVSVLVAAVLVAVVVGWLAG